MTAAVHRDMYPSMNVHCEEESSSNQRQALMCGAVLQSDCGHAVFRKLLTSHFRNYSCFMRWLPVVGKQQCNIHAKSRITEFKDLKASAKGCPMGFKPIPHRMRGGEGRAETTIVINPVTWQCAPEEDVCLANNRNVKVGVWSQNLHLGS